MKVIITESTEQIRELAISMYANEPCRICGKNISREDLENGAVFAGYSKDDKSRSAHKECWDKNISPDKWNIQ